MKAGLLGLVGLLLPLVGMAREERGLRAEERALRREEGVSGAVLAPAALPLGALALYGYMGAPEVGAGLRQGLGWAELDARVRLDWFQLSGALEVGLRREVLRRGGLTLAPTLGLGVVFSAGATYLEDPTPSGVLLRAVPGLVATQALTETVSAVGLVEVPLDVGLSASGTWRLRALGGGGAEVYVGRDMTLAALGQLGVEHLEPRGGLARTRLEWAVRVGLGLRVF